MTGSRSPEVEADESPRGAQLFASLGQRVRRHPIVARHAWAAFPCLVWPVSRVALLLFTKLSMTFVPGLVKPAGLHREYLIQFTSIERPLPLGCRFFHELAKLVQHHFPIL